MHFALGLVMENQNSVSNALDFYLEDNEEFFEFEDMTEDLRWRFDSDTEGHATFEAFVKAKGYVEEDGCKDDDKRYGYYWNPNGRFNDYQIGGRNKEALLVKSDTKNCLAEGDCRFREAPEGYRWVDIAPIGSIEWEKMKELGSPLDIYVLVDTDDNWIQPKQNQNGIDFFEECIKKQDKNFFLAIIDAHEQ